MQLLSPLQDVWWKSHLIVCLWEAVHRNLLRIMGSLWNQIQLYRHSSQEKHFRCAKLLKFSTLKPQRLTSIFFLITMSSLNQTLRSWELRYNDHQLKKLLIGKQILLVCNLRNVKRIMWRIYILMSGCKVLRKEILYCSRHFPSNRKLFNSLTPRSDTCNLYLTVYTYNVNT